MFPCLKRHEAVSSEWQETHTCHWREKHLSVALETSTNHLWPGPDLKFSNEIFEQESSLLQYMNMLVPLKSQEAAMCSRSSTFEYIPLHVRDPSLEDMSVCEDCMIPTPQLRDLNDHTIPEHVRKGINYEESDLITFNPEVSIQ